MLKETAETTAETLALMREAYEEEKLSRIQSIADDSRSGRPLTSTTDRNIGQIRDLIVADRKFTIDNIYQKYLEFHMVVAKKYW
ncbi:hypothetical protein LAZ67_23001107 [Cordylochernes scorpioides]|uniref:Uncharacterized protein n=1 Tax=Cordylochernes scorpioides TaxID=51811 RepID=A0ABY6LTJ3_9ARAC|nr:hypothetical protein LAZ67_23001107 [Cordylochernes scorpioides]